MSNYKEQYRDLKKKLKFLIFENECFQEALRSTQRQLLKVNRDKSFLLDRLLHFEKVDASLTESVDDTDSSEEDASKVESWKWKKGDYNMTNQSGTYSSGLNKFHNSNKKKKPPLKTFKKYNTSMMDNNSMLPCSLISDGHMTPEEVERHLESRQGYLDMVPEKAPPTVPTEMFSNDVSMDKLE